MLERIVNILSKLPTWFMNLITLISFLVMMIQFLSTYKKNNFFVFKKI